MTVSDITGSQVNILLKSPGYSDPVTVDSGASITATDLIPYALAAETNWTVYNLGAVDAAVTSGLGVELPHGGTIINGAGGAIYGYSGGIAIRYARGNSISNSGLIKGGGDAIYLAGGYITNASGGLITGANQGIRAAGSYAATVVNAGSIDGSTDTGIYFFSGGLVHNGASGTITGNDHGVDFYGGGTVVNAGQIESTGTTISIMGDENTGIYFGLEGYLSNGASGIVAGNASGVFFGGGGTIVNAGKIGGTGTTAPGNTYAATGIFLTSAGYISNAADGTITGYTDGIINNGGGTIVNAGKIGATASGNSDVVAGISFGYEGHLSNVTGGTIAGNTVGVFFLNGGTIENDGQIKGAGNTASGNANAVAGIVIDSGGYIFNGAGGTIKGGNIGVSVRGGGTVINAGLIEVIGATASGNGSVVLPNGGDVYNGPGGTIKSKADGVIVGGGNGTIDNAGSISGFYHFGVALYAGGSVTNQSGGIIAGNLGVYFTSGGTVDNRAGAVIEGYNYGVFVSGGAGTVENAGTINFYSSAPGTEAVSFAGAGNNLLLIGGGAVFDGVVIAAGTGNTIELIAAYGPGTLSGMGSEYQGFQTVRVDSGANWTLSGTFSGATAVYGIANGGAITSGGVETLHSSGEAVGAQVSSGGVLLSVFGQLSDTVVFAGGTAEEFVGSSTDTTLSGGHLLVFNGAVASTVDVGSGGFALAGEFAGGVVGGTIDGATVSSGGIVVVGNDAVVSGATIQGGGTLFELAGVTSNVDLSGSQLVATTLFGPAQLAVVSATTVESGGLQTVNADGSTVDATILGGGEVKVNSGGVAEDATVSSGGTLVSVYGEISSTTIHGGGLVDQFVGTGEDTTLSGGHLLVLNGAVTSMVNVEAGGLALAGTFAGGVVGGTIDDAMVSPGGLVVLGTQSVLSGAVLQKGGTLFELAGQASNVALAGLEFVGGGLPGVTPPNPPPPAVTTGATVSSGGEQVVNSNGSAVDTNVLSGGEIVFDGGVVSNLMLSSGGEIDLATFAFSSATSLTFAENAQNTGGVLTVSGATSSLAVNLLGQYVAGDFQESQDSGTGTAITYAPAATSNVELTGAHY
jgi:autotransporter passenger strand-loop-strand repeat protein